jgi:phosphoribosylamine--glycine ligase
MSKIDVLIVGSGGREHALAWKLAQSRHAGKLYAAPGNPGIAALAECIPIAVSALDDLVALAREKQVGLVVVGPEVPLALGLADRLREAGIPVFGPSAAAAQIESSKSFARELMTRAGVPQPEYASFTTADACEAYFRQLAERGVTSAVVKASGLAAGKGAIVCDTLEEARAAARDLLGGSLGSAGSEIVVEERLEGEEASLFVLTDGERVLPLAPAQDYKRIGDGDQGPNTGGMGSYAPAPVLDAALVDEAVETIVRPTLHGLRVAGHPFQGCLYAGLMKTPAGLKVIEFNCRFGDPETQVVLPLLEADLLELMCGCAHGTLETSAPGWKPSRAVTVVLAGRGYPARSDSGTPIHGIEEAAAVPGAIVFHAGTTLRDGQLVTAGGRVLSVTGVGATFRDAIHTAYAAADRIEFEGRQLRRDIAARVKESS